MSSEYPFRPTMRKVFWKDVHKEVHRVAPEFAKLVDEIDPGKDYPLYKACYPYGSLIVKEGVCYYPNKDGNLVTLDDLSLEVKIKQDLSYAGFGIPPGMVLNNTIELFIPTQNRFFSLQLFEKGHIFALWRFFEENRLFHPTKMFNLSSGARSIFLLPNIGDSGSHKKLRREFGIKLPPSKNLFSQWELFSAIANNEITKCNWHSDVIFFAGKWPGQIRNPNKKWVELSRYLIQSVWLASAFRRNKNFFDFAFSKIQEKRNLRPNPYIADTAKYIFEIAVGAFIGFAPAINDLAGPIEALQKVFLDIYKLKKYAPTFMQPDYFSLNRSERPLYYSLAVPTSMEFSPKSRKQQANLYDLRELAHIIKIICEEIPKEYLKINNTYFATVTNNVRFDYFHDRYDYEKCVNYTWEMPKFDPTLIQCPNGYDNTIFPTAASFLRGSIRIASMLK